MIFKTLIQNYKERYAISNLDLADAAETNRLHLFVISFFLILVGFVDLVVLFILHYRNPKEHLFSFIYFAAFLVLGTYTLLLSSWSKKVSREKAYVSKTTPAYIIITFTFLASLYNFYILKQPFNGVISYCLTGFLSIFVFSLSPIYFLTFPVVIMGIMAPVIYSNFGITGLMDSVLCTILIFIIALYKRYFEKKQILFLKNQKQALVAKTFGNFTLMYDNRVIHFSRTKSDELIAYLILKKGTSVKSKELINILWGDHADSVRYGSNLRNLIVDIKYSLKELNIQNFFIAEYNNFRINPEIVSCDYYDFIKGESSAIKNFAGEFMSQYSWAEETTGFLEQKAMKK